MGRHKFNFMKWNGSSDLANQKFGECYGIDWNYVSKESSDIIVGSRLIKIGDII